MSVSKIEQNHCNPAPCSSEACWNGKVIEKISIDDQAHWKKVLDARSEEHGLKYRSLQKKFTLLLIAGTVAAAAFVCLAAAHAFLPALLLAGYFALFLPYSFSLLQTADSSIHHRAKRVEFFNKSVNLDNHFSAFVSTFKLPEGVAKVTEKQFFQALDLYQEKCRAESKVSQFDQKIQFLKSGFTI